MSGSNGFMHASLGLHESHSMTAGSGTERPVTSIPHRLHCLSFQALRHQKWVHSKGSSPGSSSGRCTREKEILKLGCPMALIAGCICR